MKQQADRMIYSFFARKYHSQPHCLKRKLSQRQEKVRSIGFM